jgi:hypothetical protein
MATRAQPVKIGPWPGGINLQSDPTAVADEEAVDITNFDIDIDGSLKSRPSIIASAVAGGRYSNRILGVFSLLNGTHYVIFSGTDGAGAVLTSYYNINTATFGTITNTIAASSMVQFNNKIWLVAPPGQANPGGSWDGTTFTTVPTMAKGITCCMYKNLMFVGTGDLDITSPSVVYWCSATVSGPDPGAAWDTSKNFIVNNGDGQSIRKIYSFQGSIVIFKSRSTYIYAYESDPFKGQQQQLSSSVGIDGLDGMTENQSVMYVMSGGDAYAINNWTWEQLNIRVPFAFSDSYINNWARPSCVSSVGARVIFRYYDSHYVFNTTTRTWTKWLTALTPDMFIKSPLVNTATGIDQYFAGNYLKLSAGANANRMFAMKDAITGTEVESYTASLRTKVYAFNVPYTFKHMTWWGIDLLSKSKIDVTVIPVTYGLPVRWNQLPPRTWGAMSPATWGQPLDVSITVSDSVDIKNTSGVRMFVKYLKSLRFRQVQFTITSVLDGTTATGPLQLYSVTSYIVNKQLVPQKIN